MPELKGRIALPTKRGIRRGFRGGCCLVRAVRMRRLLRNDRVVGHWLELVVLLALGLALTPGLFWTSQLLVRRWVVCGGGEGP